MKTKIVKIGHDLYRVRAYINGKFSRHWTQTIEGNLWAAKQRASKNEAYYSCLTFCSCCDFADDPFWDDLKR